jgi:hypothetical protein
VTPEEERLRDAWIAELWAPVREYHAFTPERIVRTSRSPQPREMCPVCNIAYARNYLPDHTRRAHSQINGEVA